MYFEIVKLIRHRQKKIQNKLQAQK